MKKQLFIACAVAGLVWLAGGCTAPRITNTARSGVEQLLISRVVEECVDQMSFDDIAGHTVALDYSYFAPQGDKEYVQACLETKLLCSDITIVPADKAEYTIRLYCGALATDDTKFNIGTPELPVPVPQSTIQIVIPELSVVKRITRTAVGRFSVVVLDNKTQKPAFIMREVSSRTVYNDWIVFFFIPYHSTDTTDIPAGDVEYGWF